MASTGAHAPPEFRVIQTKKQIPADSGIARLKHPQFSARGEAGVEGRGLPPTLDSHSVIRLEIRAVFAKRDFVLHEKYKQATPLADEFLLPEGREPPPPLYVSLKWYGAIGRVFFSDPRTCILLPRGAAPENRKIRYLTMEMGRRISQTMVYPPPPPPP